MKRVDKRIGLIGGMSNESTVLYYNHINKEVNAILGEHNIANILLLSINFNDVVTFMHEGEWSKLSELLVRSAKDLITGGADIIAICCNSAHKVAAQVKSVINVPFLHILDPTAQCIKQNNLHRIGLLGNKFTMEDGFYQDYLKNHHNIDCVIPELADRDYIHNIIYNELCYGNNNTQSQRNINNIILRLKRKGAQGIILGCTELPMLIQKNDCDIKIFDATWNHSLALAHYCIQKEKVK